MSKKRLFVSASIAVLVSVLMLVIFAHRTSNGFRPVVRFLSYSNANNLKMALFVVSNLTAVPINFTTSPQQSVSNFLAYFEPLPPGEARPITVPCLAGRSSVTFSFVARKTYAQNLSGAWRFSGIKGAVKVTKEYLSGVAYFEKKPGYDLEVGLP